MERILIVDHYAVFRQGLKQVIAKRADTIVVDEAVTGHEALGKVRANDYDLVILDISLPDTKGLEVLAGIKEVRRSLPILVLTMHDEEPFARRAFKAGASGYLTKGCTSSEVLTALEKVAQGLLSGDN